MVFRTTIAIAALLIGLGGAGAIPPGPAGSAKQDAILQEVMRSPLSISQTGPAPHDSDGGGSMQGDAPNMAGSPPDVRAETRSVHEAGGAEKRPYYDIPGAISPRPQPVLPNRMQSCGRRCSRGCRSDPANSDRDQTIRA